MPVLLGRPTTAMVQGRERGRVLLGGCVDDPGRAVRRGLQLRDVLVDQLTALGGAVPPALKDRRVELVRDSRAKEFGKRKADGPKELAEGFTAYRSGLAEQVRKVRNDADHPESIGPGMPEAVHAALLIIQKRARLVTDLAGEGQALYP